MKTWFLSAVAVFAVATSALAQSAPAAAPAAPAASSTTGGKKAACQAAAQSLKGQDKRDQLQLCLAQAHLDCVKQAIDLKTAGPQRRDFIKTCMGG